MGIPEAELKLWPSVPCHRPRVSVSSPGEDVGGMVLHVLAWEGRAPQDSSLRACILQETRSLHINLLLDWQLPLLLNFSVSGQMVA